MADEKIAPALTPEEWADRAAHVEAHLGRTIDIDAEDAEIEIHEWQGDDAQTDISETVHIPVRALPALMALANATLPDDDPRKITRDALFGMQEVIANFRAAYVRDDQRGDFMFGRLSDYAAGAERIAAALESLLPPETCGGCGHPRAWHVRPNAGTGEGCTARGCQRMSFREPAE